jgi:preprotein translocase subunit SecG
VDGNTLQLTLREMRRHLSDPRTLGTMAVVAVVLGLSGPFGSFETISLLPRLVYWAATVFLTYSFGYGLSMLADSSWGTGRPFWIRLVIMVVPAGLAATVIVTLINLVTFGTSSFDPAFVLLLLGQCFIVAVAVVVVILLLEPKARPTAEAAASSPTILERVPLPQRGRLIALIVEDHYVDIVTDRGKTLVLMRLADAMRETGSVAGLQIHRSHWVALDAVVKTHRVEGKLALELSNGLRLPVSRSYLPAAKEAGLA